MRRMMEKGERIDKGKSAHLVKEALKIDFER